jgi:hypothetical protein
MFAFVATALAVVLLLLPMLLPESQVAVTGGRGRKGTYWKPSVAESMSFFIDVQLVQL